MAGIATVIVAWNGGRIRLVNPPRVLITRLPRGTAFGQPGQRRVLSAVLSLLAQPAPLAPIYLDQTTINN